MGWRFGAFGAFDVCEGAFGCSLTGTRHLRPRLYRREYRIFTNARS